MPRLWAVEPSTLRDGMYLNGENFFYQLVKTLAI